MRVVITVEEAVRHAKALIDAYEEDVARDGHLVDPEQGGSDGEAH